MVITANADERRQAIIDAAARLFNEKGYHLTSMEDIAEAVGLRKPTLYWYISCKEEILYMVNSEYMDRTDENLSQLLNSGKSNSELLQQIMTDIIVYIAHYPGFTRSFQEHYRELSGQLHDDMKKRRDDYFRQVVGIISDGIAAGEFKEVDPTITAMAFFGMCNWVYKWYRPDGKLSPEEISAQFWNIFANGVVKKD